MMAHLERLIRTRVSREDQRAWFDNALSASETTKLAIAFAFASRKLGTEPIGVDELAGGNLAWLAKTSSLDELARIALLARAVAMRPSESRAAIAAEWYRQG